MTFTKGPRQFVVQLAAVTPLSSGVRVAGDCLHADGLHPLLDGVLERMQADASGYNWM